ncbi:ADGB protein, partial [Polypterus senegalus]
MKDVLKKKSDKEKEKKSPYSAQPPSEAQAAPSQTGQESITGSQLPQMVVCAIFLPLQLSEKISVLGLMADSSEKLRQYGLSHLYSHPVLVTRTRSGPLVVPPKPPALPRWKLIRQKKQIIVTDEPKDLGNDSQPLQEPNTPIKVTDNGEQETISERSNPQEAWIDFDDFCKCFQRHVFRFTARSPLGYNIHLCSSVPFIFGEEETVMPCLQKESNGFTAQAMAIMKAVGSVMNHFSDKAELPQALKELELVLYPPQLFSSKLVKAHFKAFNNALQYTFIKVLRNNLTLDDVFAIKVFTRDASNCTIAKESPSLTSVKTETPEQWINREATEEEIEAVTVIQAEWRRYYIRKIKRARKPGTKDNEIVTTVLQRIWSVMEPNIEQHAVTLLRVFIKVTANHLATIQIQTSKPDVYIKLQILNNEKEVASSTGKGHVIIPAFTFLTNERPLSTSSQTSGKLGKKERNGSATSQKQSRSVISQINTGEENNIHMTVPKDSGHVQQAIHKYVIQATVLHKSWPLSETQLDFVKSLKDLETKSSPANTEKSDENSPPLITDVSQNEQQKSPGTPKSSKKGKEKPVEKSEKDKPNKEKEKVSSRPESQALDVNMPFWTLHVVSGQGDTDKIQLKKDTERADEIRNMKQAWESAEPGRAMKALQSRLRYINKYLRRFSPELPAGRVMTPITTEEKSEAASVTVSPETLSSCEDSSQLQKSHLDLSPFFRNTLPEPVLKDISMTEQQNQDKHEEIRQFRQVREFILQHREMEQKSRSLLKMKQLEMYEQLQISLDENRQKILEIRDAYRKTLLDYEHKNEMTTEVVTAPVAETEKRSPPSRQKSSRSGKKK